MFFADETKVTREFICWSNGQEGMEEVYEGFHPWFCKESGVGRG